MPSLPQLLTSHRRLLVLDATSMNTQVGLLQADQPAIWDRSPQEAGTAIFTGTESVLQRAGITFAEVGAFVFCAGPGSMLGTRTIAMALRTWQVIGSRPVYAYQSLAVAAGQEWTRQPGRSFSVIADARRDTWHVQTVDTGGRLSALQRVPAAALPPGELVTPESFRAWAPPPRPVGACSYDLATIFSNLGDGEYFHPTSAPETFQHEAPEYKKWSAQIHRAAPR
jgi:tRNA threonylcarbamoyladenosine biosynthesis protein TsaB